jgi:hypothetical protein
MEAIKKDHSDGGNSISQPSVDIHALPIELIVAIFEAGLLLHSLPQDPPFPLLLCGVNRHWRAIAIHTPSLWSNIVISRQRPAKAAFVWIERSKLCLLDVTFDISLDPSIWMSTLEFHNIVLPSASRWRQLILKGVGDSCIPTIKKFLRDLFVPHLETIQLDLSQHHSQPHQTGHIFIRGSPALRSVKLGYPCFRCFPPFKDLESLDIRLTNNFFTQISDIIEASPGLKSLAIRELCLAQPERRFQARSLHSFAISFRYSPPFEPSCLFSPLFMPNLEYLELSSDPPSRLVDYLQLYHPVRLQLPKLQILRMQHLSFSHEKADLSRPRMIPLPDTRDAHGDLVLCRDSGVNAGTRFTDSQKECIPWHDLGVFTLNPLQTEDIFWVQNMVLDRRSAEIPLTKVRLPQAILPFTPPGLSCLDWLRENVEVEVLEEDEDVTVIDEDEY